MTYTVILLYPDYVADQYGETWCGHVEAKDLCEAVDKARLEACGPRVHDDKNPDDFAVVAIFKGKHSDWVGPWTESCI